MKNWFEMRVKFVFGLLVFAFLVIMGFVQSRLMQNAPTPVPAGTRLQGLLFMISLFFVMQAVIYSGSGISTQSPFRAMKGVHGSTYFTLSLPVSRLRLLGVRTAMGLLELLGATLLCAAALRFLLPVMLPELSFATLDFVRYAFTMFACLTAFLSIATLLSTFLDEMWSAWGTMLIAAGLGVLASYLSVPDNINPFRVIGPAGPLVTHTIPWVAMAISVAVAVGMWIAAATVVQKRDY